VEAWDLEELRAAHAGAGRLYHEFARVPSLSLGLYRLRAGRDDPQTPHGQDEVYHVLAGRATIRVGQEDRRVQAGSTIYVAARVPHRFHAIEEDLEVLVFFAPAETPSG
jgi:mannose-6-phosphate isomerase-like protein (cupin superfamily)